MRFCFICYLVTLEQIVVFIYFQIIRLSKNQQHCNKRGLYDCAIGSHIVLSNINNATVKISSNLIYHYPLQLKLNTTSRKVRPQGAPSFLKGNISLEYKIRESIHLDFAKNSTSLPFYPFNEDIFRDVFSWCLIILTEKRRQFFKEVWKDFAFYL